MRNNKLVVAVLVLVLLIGGAVGAYMALQPGDQTAGRPQTGDLASETGGAETGDPLAYQPSGGNAPADSGETGDQVPGRNADGAKDAGPGGDLNKQTVNPDAEPTPEEPQWEAVSFEITVHGRVSIKSDGRPAVGAEVSAELSTEAAMWMGVNDEAAPAARGRPRGSVSGSAITDGSGEYSLKLNGKTFRAKAGSPGAQDGDDRSGVGFGEEQLVVIATLAGYAPARSAGIFLLTGQDHEVNLKLAIPAAVSGRVVDALSKQGIAGARGQLHDTDAWREGGSAPYSFTTDEQGYFTVNPLPASTYVASVSAAGYAGYNGWMEQGRINLSAGGETDVGEITLMRAASVVGRVLSEEGDTPLEGASVELIQTGQWGGWSRSSGRSDAQGRFELIHVEPGAYSVRVHLGGYAPLELPGQTVEAGARHDLGDLKLGRGLTLNGIVVDPDNNPVAGANLRLNQPGEGFDWMNRGSEIASATSGDAGGFELTGVSIGDLQLSVSADGFAEHSETLTVTGSQTGMRIRLSRGGVIRGRVLTAAGAPVPNATITAVEHGSQLYSLFKVQRAAMWGMLMGQDGNTASTGPDGRFVLRNVPAGTVLVCISTEDLTRVYKDDVKVENDREVDVGELRLPGKGGARVTVTEDGAPVPELGVTLTEGLGFGGFNRHEGVTDAMGVAVFKEVPEGTWQIQTSRDDGILDTDSSRRRIVIKADEITEFALELRPKEGVHLHGRLSINGKSGFGDVILVGTGDRADVVKTGKTAEGGYYEFIGLKTGRYELHLRESDMHITCKALLDLKEEGDFPYDHDFKCFAISGEVNTPENTPAQRTGVNISLTHLENERPEFAQWLRGRATPDTEGKFRFDNVMPGTYQVSATLDGVGSALAQVTIGSADETGLTLSIVQNSGSIRLTVSKLDGTPVSGTGFGLMSLERPDGKAVDLGQNFQGFFMLANGARQTIPTVEPGSFILVVRGSGYLTARMTDVVVENGKTTEVAVTLTAAAELHLTFTNPEVTQQMLEAATVRYVDTDGLEIPRDSNVLDTFGSAAPTPERPTLVAKYLGSQVAEVRVKLAGYVEISVPVQFAAGRKIEKEETLQAE